MYELTFEGREKERFEQGYQSGIQGAMLNSSKFSNMNEQFAYQSGWFDGVKALEEQPIQDKSH